MWFSIKEIARVNSTLSKFRKENICFNYEDFMKFAKENKDKYCLIESNDELLVSSWNSGDLINNYKTFLEKTIKSEN